MGAGSMPLTGVEAMVARAAAVSEASVMEGPRCEIS
jgi:hypothetical protein